VPFFDRWAWGGTEESIALVNIGGMANVTILDGKTNIEGFDTGPGNVLADILCQILFNADCDRNGEISQSGRINEEVNYIFFSIKKFFYNF
jgi:anhydro-N-acetylmuramic acid kinase